MRSRYIIALAILGAYFIASYFIVHSAILTQRSIARTVTVSGQQRMFSQRIAMFAEALVARPTPAMRVRARADLERTIATFAQQHRALTSGDPSIGPAGWPPAGVRRMYFQSPFEVDRRVRAYVAHARVVQAHARRGIRAGDPDLEYLLSVGPGPLLAALDAVVRRYDAEQQRSIAIFEQLQLAVLALGLSTLAIIWWTILRPLEREIALKTDELRRSAGEDPLTRLFNRSAFTERVHVAIAHAARHGEQGAMLMIDLDRFKAVNDTHGHISGDAAIVRYAGILRENLRACDFVTRLGGDEFAVYLCALDGPDGLRRFLDRLCERSKFELPADAATIRLTASIGVARFPQDGVTFDELLHRSDRALYAAKAAGRGTHRLYAADDPPVLAATYLSFRRAPS